ncbi:MAG: hypothetical protein UY49_C0027G0001, partial [Microgenomates group bacterium GW2011_GWC1_49_7]
MPDIIDAAQTQPKADQPTTPPAVEPPVEPPVEPLIEPAPAPAEPTIPMDQPAPSISAASDTPASSSDNLVVPPPEEPQPEVPVAPKVDGALPPEPMPPMRPEEKPAKSKRKLSPAVLVAGILLLFAVPLSVIFVQQQQEIRSRAEGGRVRSIRDIGNRRQREAAQKAFDAGGISEEDAIKIGTGKAPEIKTAADVCSSLGAVSARQACRTALAEAAANAALTPGTTPKPVTTLSPSQYADCLRNSRGIPSAVAGCNGAAASNVKPGNLVVGEKV